MKKTLISKGNLLFYSFCIIFTLFGAVYNIWRENLPYDIFIGKVTGYAPSTKGGAKVNVSFGELGCILYESKLSELDGNPLGKRVIGNYYLLAMPKKRTTLGYAISKSILKELAETHKSDIGWSWENLPKELRPYVVEKYIRKKLKSSSLHMD